MKNTKKKVLFVATVDSHIELFHLPYLKMFKDNGYEVHVATNTDKKIQHCDKKHKISIARSPFKLCNLKAIRQLKKIVNEEHFDIIHCHTPMGGVVARLAAKKAHKHGTRMIYTAHGFHFYKGAPLKNWLLFYPVEKYLAKYTDTLITINNEDFERAKKKFGKRCFDIQYVPGVGVDEKKFEKKLLKKEKHELRASLGLSDDDFVMIFPAELSKRKNQMWLIKTLKPVFDEDKKKHLLLPGKDSLNGKCQKLTKKLGLEDQVHFLGFRNDIDKLLKISDLAVSSSKQEGLPVNLIEAAFCGLPIIATDCRGNRDVANILVEHNKESLINGIRDVLDCKKNLVQDVTRFEIEKLEIEMASIYMRSKNYESIAVITSGYLPVPAVKGGACEILVDSLTDQNEKYKRTRFIVFSIYSEEAIRKSMKCKNSSYVFIKPGLMSKIVDKTVFFILDKILHYKGARKFRYFLQRVDFARKCGRYLKKYSFDKVLLENHTILYNALKYRKNYKKYAGRYYYHCHNIVPSKFLMNNIISKTKKIISVSHFRNDYAKKYFGVPSSNCVVVHNCCNAEIKKKVTKKEIEDIKDKYGISNNDVVFLFVGRIDKDKGALELVRAFNMANNKKSKLIIAGAPIFGDKTKTEYERIVKNEVHKNDRNIIFTGYINHSELNRIYAITDIVVVPSMVEDSAPLVVLEGNAWGKAIIATRCGGIPEYVNDKSAILIEKNDNYLDNLKSAIIELCKKPTKTAMLSKESKKQSLYFSEQKYYFDLVSELQNES